MRINNNKSERNEWNRIQKYKKIGNKGIVFTKI